MFLRNSEDPQGEPLCEDMHGHTLKQTHSTTSLTARVVAEVQGHECTPTIATAVGQAPGLSPFPPCNTKGMWLPNSEANSVVTWHLHLH